MIVIQTDNGDVEVEEPTERPARTPRPAFSVEWFGSDGQVWDLTRGPVWLMPGARGFGRPTPHHWRREGLSHGSSHNGHRIPAREVYMPSGVVVPRDKFLDVDRAFDAGFNPDATGRLRVTTPTSEWREIECRYDEGLEGEGEFSPLFNGVSIYPIRMTAEDPFWRGAPVTREFKTQVDVAARPTFPPVGNPLALYFKRGDTLDGEGQVTNPGDVPAYAVWTVTAPFTGFEVGIGDQFVKMTLTKTTGSVTIDTTGGMTRMLDETGANVRAFASDFKTRPIPPGETTLKLNVTAPGVGSSVTVSFQPRYNKAW